MEHTSTILYLLLFVHGVQALIAGIKGETRNIGFLGSMLLYFFCPLVWLGVFPTTKDKRDMQK